MEIVINRPSSEKSRSSRFGKVSDVGRKSEELEVVHETIPESPEPTATEPKTWNPNRESAPTIGSAGFEAFVDKKEKRGSGSSSSGGRLSLGWSGIGNDFSLRPLDGGRSRDVSVISVCRFLGFLPHSLGSPHPHRLTKIRGSHRRGR